MSNHQGCGKRMTKEQKLEVLEMRMRGASVTEISKEVGFSASAISVFLGKVLNGKNGRTPPESVYPNIKDWMRRESVCVKELAAWCGHSQRTVSSWLLGETQPTLDFIKMILQESGLSFEDAFEREERHD